MRVVITAIASFVVSSSAQAEDPNDFNAPTAECVAAAGVSVSLESCVGLSSKACQLDSPGGNSIAGMIGCTDAELRWWDARRNLVYQELREGARANDEANEQYAPSAPSQAKALRDMQRAWIDFHDATCHYEASHWGPGQGGCAGLCLVYALNDCAAGDVS